MPQLRKAFHTNYMPFTIHVRRKYHYPNPICVIPTLVSPPKLWATTKNRHYLYPCFSFFLWVEMTPILRGISQYVLTTTAVARQGLGGHQPTRRDGGDEARDWLPRESRTRVVPRRSLQHITCCKVLSPEIIACWVIKWVLIEVNRRRSVTLL